MLMSRYFYCPGHAELIRVVVESCIPCRSLATLPKVLTQESTQRTVTVGRDFAIDLMERHGQKIFLAIDKFSQMVWLRLVPDQTANTLREAIVETVLPWCGPEGAEVRCDGATALASLAKESEEPDSLLFRHKIKLVVGQLSNPNKNATAENALKQAQVEILK